MRKNPEYQLCKGLATWMRLQYPKVIYHYDLAGLNLSRAQAGMMSGIQGRRGFPDFAIYQKSGNGLLMGLFLEIKKEGTKIYLKDGVTLVADPHIREQAAMLLAVRGEGYYAAFGVGFDDCILQIKKYLSK